MTIGLGSKTHRRVASDPAAEPMWARFYELGSNRPIFLGRDSVVHYTYAEIEYERAMATATTAPGALAAAERVSGVETEPSSLNITKMFS